MPRFFLTLFLSLVAILPLLAQDGKAIYDKMCLRCHGSSGEGTKEYAQPLEGDKSIGQLAKYIARTMPEDKPGTCTGKDAEAVAAYIHGAFYSATARERNRPARVELTRLTVKQYRNALADVVGSFRGGLFVPGSERGLKAEYFKKRRFNNADKVLDRVDAEVNFDFKKNAPVEDKMEAHEFSIRWNGSLLPIETGYYEFIISTEHAARLWINQNEKPLIDAWVKSGSDTSFKGSLFLLAGRPVPLRLEFTKAKQGVDDSKNQKTPPPVMPAMIKLSWKAPTRTEEIIPNSQLLPQGSSEVYALGTNFPADDRSLGWIRGTTISKAWDQATTEAALETANYISENYQRLAGIGKDEKDPKAKLLEFARRFALRATHHPIEEAWLKKRITQPLEQGLPAEIVIKRFVLLVLKLPQFLYTDCEEKFDNFDVASRLSFAMWDSLPDPQLLDAAKNNQLQKPEVIRTQAQRMLKDLRTQIKVRDFLWTWLKLDQAAELSKDHKRFPEFTRQLENDFRTSLDMFLHDAVWTGNSDFRQLLLSNEIYANDRLAKFYGLKKSDKPGFEKVKLEVSERAGVITQPLVLSHFAYHGTTSPIHRGVFLARGILGRSLRPPQEAFTPFAEDLHPNLTTRERVALQTKSEACMSCHGLINPLGFTLEQYDAVGRFRKEENNKPIDATGGYTNRAGTEVQFKGARDLAEFLAKNDEVHEAFIEQLFHAMVQQPLRAYGPKTMEQLRPQFAKNNYSIQSLIVDIAVLAAQKPS